MRQRADACAVLPAVVSQADQAVALRVAAGEQGAARRRAQRCGGVRAGEQDALGGELVESRAGDVGVAVHAEIAAEVVPMHDQHVVSSRLGHYQSFLPRRSTEQGLSGFGNPFAHAEQLIPNLRIHPQVGLAWRVWSALVVGSWVVSNVCSISWWRRPPVPVVPVRWGRGRGWRTPRCCAAAVRRSPMCWRRRLAADGSAEREQWCVDNWDAVAAEVGRGAQRVVGGGLPSAVDRPGAAGAAAAGGRGVRRRADLLSAGELRWWPAPG